MERHEFAAEIEGSKGGGALIEVPFDVEEVFGVRGRVPVRATFDGEPYRGSLAPMGKGRHVLGVRRDIRSAIGKDIGDVVHVTVEYDDEERVVDVPDDVDTALAEHPRAADAFERLSYSHQREYIEAIEDARKPETRAKRITEMIRRLGA